MDLVMWLSPNSHPPEFGPVTRVRGSWEEASRGQTLVGDQPVTSGQSPTHFCHSHVTVMHVALPIQSSL